MIIFRIITVLIELAALAGLIVLLRPIQQWQQQFNQLQESWRGSICQSSRKIKETGRTLDNIEGYLIAFQASQPWQMKIFWMLMIRMLQAPGKTARMVTGLSLPLDLSNLPEARTHIVKAEM